MRVNSRLKGNRRHMHVQWGVLNNYIGSCKNSRQTKLVRIHFFKKMTIDIRHLLLMFPLFLAVQRYSLVCDVHYGGNPRRQHSFSTGNNCKYLSGNILVCCE